MIKKIVLSNYMSHIHTELELAGGLTVLVGPNNCGKSAVVEAIRTVCENSGKDFMVRHGEKQCRVQIETDDGHTIEWKRDKSVVSYEIDGRAVHRLGGGVPDDLHELLRLPRISSPDGDDKFDIHIASQKSPLFLLERSGRESAMFFASSSDASLVMEMQRRHKQRWTDRRRDKQQLEVQQQQCRDRVGWLDPVPVVDQKLIEAEQLFDRIGKATAAADRLATELKSLQQQADRARQMQDRFAALQPLPAPPALEETRPLEKLLGDIEQAQRLVLLEMDRCSKMEALASPPPMADAGLLQSLCNQLRDCAREAAAGHARSMALQKLAEAPTLVDTVFLQSHCSAIESKTLECERHESTARHLGRLHSPPDLDDPARLNQLSSELNSSLMVVSRIEAKLKMAMVVAEPPELADAAPLTAFISGLAAASETAKLRQVDVDRATAETAAALDSIRIWAAANPSCPVCGATVVADDLIAVGGHGHA